MASGVSSKPTTHALFLPCLALALALALSASQCRALVQAPAVGSVPVCWSSDQHGGHVADSSASPPAFSTGAVVFVGLGGKACHVGATCAFEMLVRRPATWAQGTQPRQRELMAVLSGPALALAPVEEVPPMDGTRFRFSFQVWDKGVYKVSVRNNCGTLQWRTKFRLYYPHQVATWDLNVTALEPGALREQQGQAFSILGTTGPEPGAEAEAEVRGVDPRPCAASSVQGRWLLLGNKYRWVQYPCARTVPLEDWIPELNKAGIREINFIGDSHQRQIAHHLYYLVAKEKLDPREAKGHFSRTFRVEHSSGGTLVMNIYFITGIYTSGDEFHCAMTQRLSSEPNWPEISPTADVNMVDAGCWTGVFCEQSEMAFLAHYPRFMEWALAANKAGFYGDYSGDAKGASEGESLKEALMVFRTVPPRPTGAIGCKSTTNVYVNYVNKVAKGVCSSQGLLVFDSHEIEGPRYSEHCQQGHYSCDDRVQGVKGEVGEGDVIALVHFLLRYYQNRGMSNSK